MTNLKRTLPHNALATVAIVFISIACVGCSGSNQKRMITRHNDRAERQFDKELSGKIEMSERFLASYKNRGLLVFDIQPDNGVLLIDDGEVTMSDDPFYLPVGTYTFEAVWPDGTRTSRKIFVRPCLGQVSYDWDFSAESNGSSGNQKANIKANAPLHRTKVRLVKPSR